MKRLGPDVWDDENEEPIRKIGDQTLIEDEKLNELQRMVDEGNARFKDDGSRYTLPDAETMGILNRLTKVNSEPEVKRVETIKKIAQQDRPVLRQKIADKFVNSVKQGMDDVDGNAAEAGYTPSKTYGSPETAQSTISTDGFSDKTNEALRNATLATLLSGGVGIAGYGSYKAGSEFANGFSRGFNRGFNRSYESPIQTIKADELLDYNPSNRINVNPSVIEAKTSTPLLTQSTPRNARDFSYLNPKAQSIVESPYYKQGLPPVIEQNRLGVVPETKIPLQTKQQLPVDRVNPEQIKYNQLQESLKNSPTRGASFSGSPAEYSNIVGKPQLAKDMESKLAKDYFAKQILKGLENGLVRRPMRSTVIEDNPTNVFNSKSLGVNDNIDFWNNKTDDVVGHSPIDTSNLKERVNAAMKNDRFNQSFDETKNYRNYVKTLAGNTEGNPTVDMFYQGSPLSQTEVAGDVLGKLKPKQFKYNVIDDDDMFDKIFDLRRNKPLNVKLKDTGFVEGDYDIPVYENASYNKNYNSKLNMGPGGKTELGEYLNFKGFPKTPSEFVPTKSLPEVSNIFNKGASNLGKKALGTLGAVSGAMLFSNPAMAAQEMISSEGVGHSNELDAIKLMKITGMGYDEALNALAMEKAELEKEQQLQYQKEAIKAIISDKFKNNLQY